MIHVTKRILFSTFVCALMLGFKSEAQSIINPNDPVLEYDNQNPPSQPFDFFNPIVKWVRTLKVANDAVGYTNPGWNSDVYKAYAYNSLAFRVQFPKSYTTTNDGKKYPIIIFLHGQGENDNTYLGPPPPQGNGSFNYDNQFQLLQGPRQFDNAMTNGQYDGFVLAPQLQNNASGTPTVYYEGIVRDIMNIVKYMIANNKVDPFHIVVNGLSEGGVGSWEMLDMFPTYISSVIPMSSPVDFVDWSQTGDYFSSKRFTPIWVSQGGKDKHPTPAETQRIADTMAKYGANFRESFYPDAEHNTWYNVWAEQNFWPFVNNSYSSNPWMIGGLKSFWPGEPINETIGITSGFAGYEWRRNGTVINGATGNTLNVSAPGLYDAKVLRDGIWSDYSHVPINIRPGFYEAENWLTQSGIQNYPTTDGGAGEQQVINIDNGDWMDYSINPYSTGTFTLQLRVATSGSGGQVQVKDANGLVLATINIPYTGSYSTWQTTIPVNVQLSAGLQTIRLQSVTDVAFNINWLQFGLMGQSPLPVKFVYFNAQCNSNGVNLQWKTAQEQNTKEFSVQRSSDGTNWTEIGKSAAAGQSAQERGYSFVDKNPSANSMYRIVETDMTGQQIITTIVRSSCSTTKETVSLYPNPFAQNSSVNITLSQSQRIKLRVVDATGAIIQQKELLLPSGNSSIPLVMSSYPKGVYAVTVQYSGQVKTLKFIKN
jgi:predicted esterase